MIIVVSIFDCVIGSILITLLFQMLQQRETKIDTMMIILRIFCKKLRKKKVTYNHIKSKLAEGGMEKSNERTHRRDG